jgi:hypothetical protein
MSLAGGLFLFFQAVSVWAASTTFTVSATVPDPSAISMTVSSINSTSNAFTAEPAGTTALSFDPMTFNTTNNIYLPDHYFALDIGVSGGAGEPDVTFTYNEGANPNGATNGMGHKSSATFAEETSSGETLLTAHPKTMLINVSGEHVASTELATGAFLRVYLGVCTGNTGTDPSGCQPFSNADAAGEYTGSLLVTAVVN